MKRLKNRAPPGIAAALALMVLWTEPVLAQQTQPTLGAAGNQAWARGVSTKNQLAAREQFELGNERLRDSIFVEAIKNYRQALKYWDHPAIHYNLALALMTLDQPVEVHEHLVAALRYGPEPLDANRFEHARDYKSLIEKQLAWVELTCDAPGATVTMNGKPLFMAPGHFQGLVRPGTHSLIAFKEGYLPTDMSRTLMPGEKVRLDMRLYTPDQVIRYRRRWSTWVPWTVLGAGLATTVGSGLLHLEARERFRAFDARAQDCGIPGCSPETLTSLRSRGDTLQKAAVGGYVIGGAAVVAGAVLLYLNRPQSYRLQPAGGEQQMAVTPLLGTEASGLLGTFHF